MNDDKKYCDKKMSLMLANNLIPNKEFVEAVKQKLETNRGVPVSLVGLAPQAFARMKEMLLEAGVTTVRDGNNLICALRPRDCPDTSVSSSKCSAEDFEALKVTLSGMQFMPQII